MKLMDFILDPFTYLSYKKTWHEDGKTTPSWVGIHTRRLQAYRFLEHYYRNGSRWLVSENLSEEDRESRREYGDAALLVNQTMASVLGLGGMALRVEGAELQPMLEGDTPPVNEGPTANAAPPPGAETTTPTPTVAPPAPTAPDVQLELLRKWVKDDRFNLKQIECERNASKLGDGVYVLGWSTKKKRPVLNVYDPGFYFPVYEADGSDEEGFTEDFPSKVHIAYEFEDQEATDVAKKRKVRRITYELVPYEDGRTVTFQWNTEPSDRTCWMSDGWWFLEPDTFPNFDKLDPKKGHYRVQDLDLAIDFIPVVHLPNTPAENEIWGTSTIAAVLQILDDLQSSDTDLQAASATTGSPPLSLKGTGLGSKEVETYGPGSVIQTENGIDMVDTSRSLTALVDYVKHLLERLSVNARIPESMLGRIKPSDVPSGIALWLSFQPHSTMIEEMRKVRYEKYAILFKFVSRFYMQAGELKEIFPVTAEFGTYLPADKAEVMTIITQAANTERPVISLQTMLKMAMAAGIPIESIANEIALIQQRDFAGATELANMTMNPQDGADYLGIEINPPVEETTETTETSEDLDEPPLGGGLPF